MLKKLLETVGIDPARVRMEFISASEGQKFSQLVAAFTEDLSKLGPNPLRARAM